MFNNGSRLRVNMGNIYTAQKKYPQAIKMYRMALDQIGEVHKSVRLKILQNIGSVFVKMGQYADAITSFEHIMSEQPDFKTGIKWPVENLRCEFQGFVCVFCPVYGDCLYCWTGIFAPQFWMSLAIKFTTTLYILAS